METSFENLIESHRQALERAALKFCHGDFDLAQDMVQDTFVKALKNADRFAEGTNLRAWLMRILYNTVMSVYRQVFLMAALEDSPYQEIADTLGIPVGTVMSRLWRARQTLQRKLSPASAN